MANKRVLISGFPEGTTEEQLQIHFQSRRRSGGGDISAIEMREGEAVITFEEEGMFTSYTHLVPFFTCLGIIF